jgi:acyl-CoA synthetase (AMP-forming)/AMP-acid ligase II
MPSRRNEVSPVNAADPPVSSAPTGRAGAVSLGSLIADLPLSAGDTVVASDLGRLSLGELRARVTALAETLREAQVRPGHPVGSLVARGPSSIVAMFATWAVGAVYIPINRRFTTREISSFLAETPVALLIGAPADLDAHGVSIGIVAHDYQASRSWVRSPAGPGTPQYEPDIAFVLRTSGTTGRPKAVLLRHSGTIDALDASLEKLRRSRRSRSAGDSWPPRMNLIPLSLALWAGVFNTLFSFRAGFGIVLLDRFTPSGFAVAVREHGITSTVLAPAMIAMLVEAGNIGDLAPLRLVRSITAPLSPELARQFHRRYGVFVLNSYGQTELGGEVVGWTAEDLRAFGEIKLGAAGRAYDHVDLRIRREDGSEAPADELGEVHVRSPYRMHGYALANGSLDDAGEQRFIDGYLRTGDIGRVDADGFLWVQGRVSDMINRGGLKVFPDEVEETLRQHPAVRDAGVAGVPDRRLGEVPHAWIVAPGNFDPDELTAWCRHHLAPYKVPTGFTRVDSLPRSDIGKLLRRELSARYQRP